MFSGCPLASCDDLSVTLQPASRQGERRAVALSGSSDILSFSFDNVLPGKYKGFKYTSSFFKLYVNSACSQVFTGTTESSILYNINPSIYAHFYLKVIVVILK